MTNNLKALILSEIRRLSDATGAHAIGKQAFEAETGISEGKWCGVYWTKWSEAVKEAGFSPNSMQAKFDTKNVLRKVAELALEISQIPTNPIMKMRRRSDSTFPSPKTVFAHFGSQALMIEALRDFCRNEPEFTHLLSIMPAPESPVNSQPNSSGLMDGWVYLLKSGDNYKIGRSEQLERRVKQINVALPEAAVLFHAIQTDDPSGIEAYWHKRFAERRLNGEWFKLSKHDISAFKRRKFQ